MPDVALIILAAGNSSRMGQAKQLKVFAGKTLLERSIDAGCQSDCKSVIVVLGANHEQIRSQIDNQSAIFIQNPNWEQGMGSSISCAAHQLRMEKPELAVATTSDL